MELYINSPDRNYKYGDVSKQLHDEVENINKFINDYEKATDEEKLALLNYFFEFRFSKTDLINMINIYYGRNYDTNVKLPTKMELSDTVSEGHGRDFSYWKENYRIIIDAATSKGIEFEDRTYSYKELEQLIKDEIIYPIRYKLERVREKSTDTEEAKELPSFDPDIIGFDKPSWASGYIINKPNGNEELIVYYIESQKPYKELLKEVKDYTKVIIDAVKEKDPSKKELKLISQVKTLYDNDFKKKKSKKKF